VLPACYRFGRI